MNDLLNNKITNIPQKPGVYQFINDKGEIIYIGKAKNLRTRVRSYFQKNKYHHEKVQKKLCKECNFHGNRLTLAIVYKSIYTLEKSKSCDRYGRFYNNRLHI